MIHIHHGQIPKMKVPYMLAFVKETVHATSLLIAGR
jgi:hypothetical protein